MSIPESIVREIERAIRGAEFPSGMSVHDGKAKVDSSHLRRLLAELAALRERAERAEAEAAGLRADAERWRAVSAMMTHEHRADAVGWTLGALLPGDDPDAAIDAARGEHDSDNDNMVKRGAAEYTAWKEGRNGRFPVEVTLSI